MNPIKIIQLKHRVIIIDSFKSKDSSTTKVVTRKARR